jgi:hypothetical protein
MEVSVAEIELAAADTQTGQHIHFLDQWLAEPSTLPSACEVLAQSSSPFALVVAAKNIERNIPHYWTRLDVDARPAIVDLLVARAQEVPEIVGSSLIKAYAHAALFDYPDEWRSPDLLLHPDPDTPLTFALLAAVLEGIATSKNVTGRRKSQLKDFFLRHFGRSLYPRVLAGVREEATCVYALSVYHSLLHFIQLRNQDEMINSIISRFSRLEATRAIAFDCLTKIFVNHHESQIILHRKGVQLLRLLTGEVSESGKAIASHAEAISFLIKLLTPYLPLLIRAAGKDHSYVELLDRVISVVLSILPEDANEDFWHLWALILAQALDETLGRGDGRIIEFFRPRLPALREALFERLEGSVLDDGQLPRDAADAMARLTELDFQAMLEFMLRCQGPSPSLCYAVGCFTRVRANATEMGEIFQVVSDLLRKGMEDLRHAQAPNFLFALLWGLSQELSFLESSDLFDRFFAFALDALRSSDTAIASAAAYAFSAMATSSKAPALFAAEGADFVSELAVASEMYLTSLDLSAAVRMFRVATHLASIKRNGELFEIICRPLSARLVRGAADATMALEIVRDCAEAEIVRPLLRSFMLLPVQEFANAVVPDRAIDSTAVELVLSAEVALIHGMAWTDVEALVQDLLGLFVRRCQVLGCFLTTLAVLSRDFRSEISAWSEDIFRTFILPACEMSTPPLAEIMRLVAALQFGWVNVDWLMEAVGIILPAWDSEAIKWTAKAMIRVLRELGDQELLAIMSAHGEKLVKTVLAALTDGYHTDEFDFLVKLLRKICCFLSNGRPLGDDFKGLIVRQLFELLVHEPEEGFFVAFVNCLAEAAANVANDKHGEQFREAFMSFLIALKKLSPGDHAVFSSTRQAKRSSLLYTLQV